MQTQWNTLSGSLKYICIILAPILTAYYAKPDLLETQTQLRAWLQRQSGMVVSSVLNKKAAYWHPVSDSHFDGTAVLESI
jgi:hypothetical protein